MVHTNDLHFPAVVLTDSRRQAQIMVQSDKIRVDGDPEMLRDNAMPR